MCIHGGSMPICILHINSLASITWPGILYTDDNTTKMQPAHISWVGHWPNQSKISKDKHNPVQKCLSDWQCTIFGHKLLNREEYYLNIPPSQILKMLIVSVVCYSKSMFLKTYLLMEKYLQLCQIVLTLVKGTCMFFLSSALLTSSCTHTFIYKWQML